MTLVTTDMTAAHAALAAMAYLLVKHAIADFFLQTERQREEKGFYGKAGGVVHSLIHVALTAPVFLLLPPIGAALVAGLLAAEFAVHYHIDWAKEQIIRDLGWTSHDTQFWWALGVDQLLHGLTYVGLLWIVYSA
ncbi:MAG: DUF3307 domain-containing protein [Hyphomicrobium sp.]